MDDPTGTGVEDLSRGWESINEALRPIYGDQEPLHWGTMIGYRLGGPDPLDGISAYWRDDPAPHWHFVTFGFSELYEKETDDPEVSGFGFELTFRLARGETEERLPVWTLNFLQNLARYVFETGNRFAAGHHMHLNGPIALDSDTEIQAIAFRRDPELSPIDTPNGRLEFLQIVGLTNDEYLSTLRWNTEGVLDVISANIPFLLTDLTRRSLLETPSVRAEIEKGVKAEGSSTYVLYTEHASWSQSRTLTGRRISISLDVNTATTAGLVLPGRLPFAKPLTLASPDGAVTFEFADTPGWRIEPDNHLVLGLPIEVADALAHQLSQGAGTFLIPRLPRVTVKVEPSVIRDQSGNVVKKIS